MFDLIRYIFNINTYLELSRYRHAYVRTSAAWPVPSIKMMGVFMRLASSVVPTVPGPPFIIEYENQKFVDVYKYLIFHCTVNIRELQE